MEYSQTQVPYESPSSLVYERKFDIALRNTFDASFQRRRKDNQPTLFDRIILESKQINWNEPIHKTPEHWGIILRKLLAPNPLKMPTKASNRLLVRRCWAIARSTLNVQVHCIMHNNKLTNKAMLMREYMNFLNDPLLCPQLGNLLHFITWMDSVIGKSNLMYKDRSRLDDETMLVEMKKVCSATFDALEMELLWNHEILMINLSGRQYMMPKSMLLMYHNKACDLISVLLLALSNKQGIYPHNAPTLVIEMILELCQLLMRYKSKYFDLVKAWEALGVAETLVQHEKWTNTEFLESLREDLLEKTGFEYVGSRLQSILTSVSSPFRHELMCLAKITGHPLVDLKAGAHSLHQKTTEIFHINMNYVLSCINYIKESYIKNHILRFSKWPPCQINSLYAPVPLLQAYIRNVDPNCRFIESTYGPVSPRDFVFIDLLPNMRFEKLDPIIPHLKDKTITVIRSKIMNGYLSNNPNIETNWKDTRLLLAYLCHPTMIHDHLNFIDRYAKSSTLDELLDYLVIRLVPKECELKTVFRGFGAKTYESRAMGLAQEKNVMRFLEEYSNEECMTLGELDIFRRLDAFRTLKNAYRGHQILHLVVDSSAWNNRFRQETIDVPMAHTLDKIFDYPVFSKTQRAFTKTLLYVPDKENTYFWKGQEGGIEGLNQDTWVVVYIAQMKTALAQFHYKYHIFCKGDDIRVSFAIPDSALAEITMHDIKNSIIKSIKTVLGKFGHKINIQESYGSSVYYAFSKYASINRVEMPQTFRKIQKVHGANNAFLPTLDEYIASTFSNAHSACKTNTGIIGCYMVACFWSAWYLLNHLQYKDLSEDALVSALLVPSVVGGFPIIYLHNMWVRAESDLLSPFLHISMFANRFFPAIGQHMCNFWYSVMASVEDRDLLMRDPYAIPTTRPRLPSATLRGHVIPSLRRLMKNEHFIQLVHASEDPQQKLILECLRTANPFDVKVVAVLFSATPQGWLEEITRKFENARSIYEIVILRYGKRRAESILNKVLRSEKSLQDWRVSKLQGRRIANEISFFHLHNRCAAKFAADIRNTFWSTTIVGITMPPLQHQLKFVVANDVHNDNWEYNNHFLYRVSPLTDNVGDPNKEHYGTGDFSPFIGYTTRTGSVEPNVHFIEKDCLLQKIKNLIAS